MCIHVIRCFEDDHLVREGGAAVNPIEDKEIIDTELQLKDLETIESQIAKQQKVAAAGNKDAKTMVAVLEAYKTVLEQGKNARSVQFETKEEQLAAHDLFLLTTKPVLYVCNVDENSAKEGNEYSKQVEKITKKLITQSFAFAGSLNKTSNVYYFASCRYNSPRVNNLSEFVQTLVRNSNNTQVGFYCTKRKIGCLSFGTAQTIEKCRFANVRQTYYTTF